ncbi:hypothetical protein GGR53DRAFT_485372 [Hypoxylon sp. FL1150]|nr:hypothetical protein GGR53DRAFT_485372 [Hypoxylon sp. FL1150]
MTDGQGSDRSLLDRLNALKPSTVTLDSSPKSDPIVGIEPAKPLSREDALTERLKSLRNQSESKSPPPAEVTSKGAGITNSPSTGHVPQLQPHSKTKNLDTSCAPQVSIDETGDDADPLFVTDDQTLEELLADLESDQQWLDEVVNEEEEHRKVAALLEEIGKASTPNSDSDNTKTSKAKNGSADQDSSDDDSEGEHMTRETDDILARAIDEAEWEKANEPPSRRQSRPDSPVHVEVAVPDSNGNAAADKPTAEHRDSSQNDPFNLPAVPSNLQDQPGVPEEQSQDDADFVASITSRIAALNVQSPPARTLPSVPDADVDTFGLPTAPSFAPADRPAPGLVKRHGYTDEDQKTWCVVCLEDGSIKCLGCDGDVYCARCWREMHVGPSAGYDERGHRWEKFVVSGR